MKTKITTPTSPVLNYPCLRQHPETGAVALFISPGCATVLHPGDTDFTRLGERIGYSPATDWEHFAGTLILSND